jgi:hypothetical protein
MPRKRIEEILIITGDGRIVGLHSDLIPYRRMGRIVAAPRASHVEFDPKTQRWTARDALTGKVVASGPSRTRVLEMEHAYYTRLLRRGRAPVDERSS